VHKLSAPAPDRDVRGLALGIRVVRIHHVASVPIGT
jgi:hypothetical protein